MKRLTLAAAVFSLPVFAQGAPPPPPPKAAAPAPAPRAAPPPPAQAAAAAPAPAPAPAAAAMDMSKMGMEQCLDKMAALFDQELLSHIHILELMRTKR